MNRYDLHREDIEQCYDELRREGKTDADARELSKEQVEHPNADPESIFSRNQEK